MKNLILIDTFGFLFRSFFALPPLSAPNGRPTGVLMGFTNLILALHKEYRQQPLIFALESQEENLRKGIDPNYKATRPEIAADLAEQIPIVIEWISKMNLKSLNAAGFEADDVIASLARRAYAEGYQTTIITHDKDFCQLVNDRVRLYNPVSKSFMTEESCFEKYGVTPAQFVDYQSIVGDASDNVPGVRGIGAKGAANLLAQFGSLQNIYDNLDKLSARQATLLVASKESAFLSQKLVRLSQDLEFPLEFDEAILPDSNPLLEILPELQALDFKRIVQKITPRRTLPLQPEELEQQKALTGFVRNAEMINDITCLTTLLDALAPDAPIAFDTETTSLDSRSAKIVGFSFAFDAHKGYYVPLAHNYIGAPEQIALQDAHEAIAKIVQHPLIGHNLKFDLEVIAYNFDIDVNPNNLCDTMILAWMLDSDQPLALDSLAKKWLDHTMIAFGDVVPKKAIFSDVLLDTATQYAAEDAQATFALYEILVRQIETTDSNLLDVAKKLEFPFIRVIQNLEENGICINVPFFESLKKPIAAQLLELTEEIYRYAQCSFNINSPLQLGEILFERLKLPCKKRTKNGYSTNESVLLSLKDTHPIIPPLLQYREVFKLQSTYIEPLLQLAKNQKSPRIHSSFLQTGTATGRLSSRNPNLQNIPVRTDLGKQIREGFIAESGFVLLSLDYSQIELRLLAHFSGDSTLTNAFFEGADIHYETAKKIFSAELANQKRAIAKSINFGLIYGMGAKKLSETLQISLMDAKNYIQSYFDSFPTVKAYLKDAEEDILNKGYAATLLGHKRHFSFGDIPDYTKAAYLREGINTIFQGSAADLIKLAMLEIYQQNYRPSDLRMLLQIHDELIFEIREDIIDSVAQKLMHTMEHIYSLRVPLVCGMSKGKNWGELK